MLDFLNRIFQPIQDGIDLFTGNHQWRLNANDTRVIKRTRDENTTFEQARGNGVTNIVIDEVLTDQQTFAGNVGVDVAMAGGDCTAIAL